MGRVAGILFDKDGTLFDFEASWGAWAVQLPGRLGVSAPDEARRLWAAIGYDRDAARFDPASPVIAGTPEEAAACLRPFLPSLDAEALVARLNALAGEVPMVEAVALLPLLEGLRARGLRIGLATNDAEAPARAHLAASGVGGLFDFIAGSDSGHGAKPDHGMARAFAAACAGAPGDFLMVGDSSHDLLCARAAGMRAVGVLTGPARRETLAPLSEAVLPDIGHLPAYLDRISSGAA
ncbi:phosphatase [Rhodobacteraceae bacterium WD3A24]|nr:phosphatase [Rhodobacteraceae bacterium WD3A24]